MSLSKHNRLFESYPHPCKVQWSLESCCGAGAAEILPWAPGAPAGDSGREVGSIAAACRGVCADWKVSVILNTSLNLEVPSFSRAWVIYFAESIFSSFFGCPCFKSFLKTWQLSGSSFTAFELWGLFTWLFELYKQLIEPHCKFYVDKFI